MIRLRELSYPPVYQLELALMLARSKKEEDALRVLKAEPLYDVYTIEVTVRQDVDTIYSDGTYFDPLIPLQVSGKVEQSVKVAYADALQEYQTADDALWSSEEWGIYRYHVRDWFNDDPYNRWDLNEGDLRYHKFMFVRDIHMYTFNDNKEAVVVWYDLESDKSYCAHTQMIMMNT